MNLANFNDSLIVPYQQLVPNQSDPYSFNQIWTQKYGESATTAVHPYQQSMYLRNIDYKNSSSRICIHATARKRSRTPAPSTVRRM